MKSAATQLGAKTLAFGADLIVAYALSDENESYATTNVGAFASAAIRPPSTQTSIDTTDAFRNVFPGAFELGVTPQFKIQYNYNLAGQGLQIE